ncbi:hypothetical protein KOI35_27075 [Actinoplanes bogorensis]|uniref:Secreted protein n=1 Tax=Paractinoplanes bogorensis TaxID=1610840 RepID=A0ABS5YVS1_9ACTN|nr:hypothetical protein [Actinoplanes bogorensis]MBU2667176.1 hypothetical protein [Actinoplanes bogorensis]
MTHTQRPAPRTSAGKGFLRRTLGGGLAMAALLIGFVVFAVPQPAMAATQTICTDFTNAKVWQTRTSWARIRERACLEYSGAQVRPRTQVQVDWPADCTLSIGVPPSVTGGCPSSRLTKSPDLLFRLLDIQQGWKVGTANRVNGTCRIQSWNVGRLQQSTFTKTCVGSWVPRKRLVEYRVFVNVTADVWADGDGLKSLNEITASWHWA